MTKDLLPEISQQRSYNNRWSMSLRDFFLPNGTQISLYLLVSSLLLVLINAEAIWRKFSSYYLDQASFGDAFAQSTPTITDFINKLQGSRIPLFIFWAFVGCSVYIFIWFIINIISNIRNDIVADSYLQPKNSSRRLFWESVIARKILLFFCIVVLAAYTLVGLKFLVVVADFFYSAIDIFKYVSGAKILVSVLIVSFLLYVFILLSHLTTNLWRLVYRSL